MNFQSVFHEAGGIFTQRCEGLGLAFSRAKFIPNKNEANFFPSSPYFRSREYYWWSRPMQGEELLRIGKGLRAQLSSCLWAQLDGFLQTLPESYIFRWVRILQKNTIQFTKNGLIFRHMFWNILQIEIQSVAQFFSTHFESFMIIGVHFAFISHLLSHLSCRLGKLVWVVC